MLQNNYQPNLDNMQQYLNEEQQKAQQRNGEGSSITWWSIPSGMSAIRILPPWDPTGRVALQAFMHPIEYQGPKMKYKKYNWTCVARTFGKPCKICEALQNLQASGVDISKMDSNRRQFYMNAIVMIDPRYQKNPNEGVAPGTHVVVRAPKGLYDWVISQITNPMIGDITSLTNGIDIYVTKEGSGLGTQYIPTLSPNGRTAVPQEYLEKIESLHNLDELFSTGWDDETITGLLSHLNGSANSIMNNMSNTIQQMAGYQTMPTTPQMSAPQVVPQVAPEVRNAPVNHLVNNPYNNAGVAPQVPTSPFVGNPVNPPVQQSPAPIPTAPTAPAPVAFPGNPVEQTPPVNSPAGNAPKCFGQYNPSQVACVVCPFEIECSNRK